MTIEQKIQHILTQGMAMFVSLVLTFGLPVAVFAQEETSTPEPEVEQAAESSPPPAPEPAPCTSGCNQGVDQGINQGVGQGGPSLADLGGTYDESGNVVLPAGVEDTRQGANQGIYNGTESGSNVSGINENTGSGSTNTVDTAVSNTQTTGITNSATDTSTITASGNTGGNTNNDNTVAGATSTGNASVGVTQVKNDNTAVVGGDIGLSVSGHQGDLNGDLTLDFENAASLLSGDGSGLSVQAINNATGSDSTNNLLFTFEDITDTEVQNDGEITNDVNVEAITGQNDASRNTSGGGITTGDASVAATLVNLLNTTVLNGNVFVAVKDIFGNLNGDIYLPDLGQLASFLTGGGSLGVEADNNNTGSDSTNTIDVDVTDEEVTTVNNEAHIDTNISATAITGQNDANDNTGGGFIDTGDASVSASNITIANTTIEGGNWGLVIVNALNKWLGFLVGDSGEVRALSSEETIREIEARNSNTGSGSDNTIEVDSTNRDTTDVNNDATITNNVTATAITGQNTANDNTGAAAITTGNATVKATAVNIANTTVKNANLGIAVINVFGDWFGDLFYAGKSLFGASNADYQVEVEAENEQTGQDSDNTVDVTVDRSRTTDITNDAAITTTLTSNVDTGNNRTNRNTLGGSIETGNSNLALHSRTIANLTALMDGGTLNVDVHGDNNSTGVDSENVIRATVNDERIITVDNDANVSTVLPGLVNTGNNQSSDNTNGGDIESGDIGASIVVDNMVNRFILALGVDVATGSGAAAVIDGDLNNYLTGEGSTNENDIDATREFLKTLFNDAIVDTLIDLMFNTGGNESNRNTNPTFSAATALPVSSSPSYTSAAETVSPAPQYAAAIAQPLGSSVPAPDVQENNDTNDSDGSESEDDGTYVTASSNTTPTSTASTKKVPTMRDVVPAPQSVPLRTYVPQSIQSTTALPTRRLKQPSSVTWPDLEQRFAIVSPAQAGIVSEEHDGPVFPTIVVLGTIIGTLTGGVAARRLSL